MIHGYNLGVFQRSLRRSSWNIGEFLLDAPDDNYDYYLEPGCFHTLSHLFLNIPPLRCVLWLSLCGGKTGRLKLIINNDGNNYLWLLSTITVPRALHMWTHWVLISTFWRRFCYDSQVLSWNIHWVNNLVMSHGWWCRNRIQNKVIQLRDPVLAIVHSG